MKYEAHITFDIKDSEIIEAYSKSNPYWTFSRILYDPVMGNKPFCYLTAHAHTEIRLINEMSQVSFEIKAEVLRKKIERIVFDSRKEVGGGE